MYKIYHKMSSDKLPKCAILDFITDSDQRTKAVQQNLNNLAVILLLKSCEKSEKKIEPPKPKSKRGRKPKPKLKDDTDPAEIKKSEKEQLKHTIEVFKKWNRSHSMTNATCSCGTRICKFCKIFEAVKNCADKKVKTGKRKNRGSGRQHQFVQCEVCEWPEDLQDLLCNWDTLPGTSDVCDWPEDLQDLLRDWDTLPGTSDASNTYKDIQNCLAERDRQDIFDLYKVEDTVLENPVNNNKKKSTTRNSVPKTSRNTKKSARRGTSQARGRGGSNSVKRGRGSQRITRAPPVQGDENTPPNENSVGLDKIEVSNESDILSNKAAVDKVLVEFAKSLPYDILQLRPTLAENYDKAKISDYFLNLK